MGRSNIQRDGVNVCVGVRVREREKRSGEKIVTRNKLAGRVRKGETVMRPWLTT